MPETAAIRAMGMDDLQDVAALLVSAFGRQEEGKLIAALDSADDLAVGLIAELNGKMSGIAALSHLRAPEKALALGPIAVAEDARHQGVGGSLIQAAISWANKRELPGIFVLGRPRYYTRFGFSIERAAGFTHPYPPEFMLACETTDGKLGEAGELIYPPAFAALG